MLRLARTAAAVCFAVVLLRGGDLIAGTIDVSPVMLRLSPAQTNAMLSLRNHGNEVSRFQAKVYAWGQGPKGEMRLAPTRDIVFFPSTLSVAPREERKIRVGTVAPFGEREKTYRIVVNELPPVVREDGKPKFGLRLLTQMSIPIFMAPARPAVAAHIEHLGLRHRRLQLRVRNTGTLHFMIQEVRLVGRDADGRARFERAEKGWYVLADGVRLFEVEVPQAACQSLRKVEARITADLPQAQAQAAVTVGADACARP